MTCRRKPCSEYFNRFLATRIVSRVLSIQKFLNSGWVSCTPMEPPESSKFVGKEKPYCSEILPLKSYCKPHGNNTPRSDLAEFSSEIVCGTPSTPLDRKSTRLNSS